MREAHGPRGVLPTAPTPGRLLGYVLLLDLLRDNRHSWIQFLSHEVTETHLASDAAFRDWVANLLDTRPEIVEHVRRVIESFRATIVDEYSSEQKDDA